MKRSLVSLAAMAAVGAASRQNSVTLFGTVDLTQPEPEKLRIEPPKDFWRSMTLPDEMTYYGEVKQPEPLARWRWWNLDPSLRQD